MSDLTFARPMLLFVAAVPVLALIAWYAGLALNRRRARRLVRTAPPVGPVLMPALLTLCALFAVVAAAQPRWGTRTSQVPRNGAELIIVLDVSRSMDVRDVAPSRMDATKVALSQLLDRLGGDRVGLVVFAGTARLRMPLTTDIEAARQVIQSLQVAPVLVESGTDASSGIQVALDSFDLEREAGRVLLLITDGDDLGGDPATDLAALRAAGVDLLVAGAGTAEGGNVPVYDPRTNTSGIKLDESGEAIVSRLNEPFLQVVAAAGGGRYLGNDLGQIAGATQGKLQARQQLTLDERESQFPIERFQLFALIALAGVLVATALQQFARAIGRRNVLVGAVLAALAILPGCATQAHSLNEQGQRALEAGDAARAIELFLEARAEEPSDARIGINLATAYHAAGQWEDAKQASRRVLTSNDDRLRAHALSIMGHADFAQEDLPAALDSFRRSLLLEPADDRVRHDYEVVLRLLTLPAEEPDPGEGEPGDGEPGDGEPGDGEPGDGAPGASPSPGTGQPGDQPGGQPNQPGDPNQPGGEQPGGGQPGSQGGSGTPSSPLELQRQLEALDGEISDLLQEAGETPTTAQAIEILELLAERSRLAAQRDAFLGSSNPRDY